MSVTRYDLEVSEFSDCYGVEMEESTNGDYVDYDDYAKLDAKCDTENYIANALIRKLEAERDRLRKAIERHQVQKWMPEYIPHDRHDKELYAALQEAEG